MCVKSAMERRPPFGHFLLVLGLFSVFPKGTYSSGMHNRSTETDKLNYEVSHQKQSETRNPTKREAKDRKPSRTDVDIFDDFLIPNDDLWKTNTKTGIELTNNQGPSTSEIPRSPIQTTADTPYSSTDFGTATPFLGNSTNETALPSYFVPDLTEEVSSTTDATTLLTDVTNTSANEMPPDSTEGSSQNSIQTTDETPYSSTALSSTTPFFGNSTSETAMTSHFFPNLTEVVSSTTDATTLLTDVTNPSANETLSENAEGSSQHSIQSTAETPYSSTDFGTAIPFFGNSTNETALQSHFFPNLTEEVSSTTDAITLLTDVTNTSANEMLPASTEGSSQHSIETTDETPYSSNALSTATPFFGNSTNETALPSYFVPDLTEEVSSTTDAITLLTDVSTPSANEMLSDSTEGSTQHSIQTIAEKLYSSTSLDKTTSFPRNSSSEIALISHSISNTPGIVSSTADSSTSLTNVTRSLVNKTPSIDDMEGNSKDTYTLYSSTDVIFSQSKTLTTAISVTTENVCNNSWKTTLKVAIVLAAVGGSLFAISALLVYMKFRKKSRVIPQECVSMMPVI